ncbi:hypothetical protein H0H92_011605, partial [Tricholoma furcatifolium]
MTKGITEEKLHSFDVDMISQIMSTNAPYMWELIDGLLAADAELQLKRDTWRRRKMQPQQDSKDADEHVDSEEKYWEFLDEGVPIIDEQDDEPEDLADQGDRKEQNLKTMSGIGKSSLVRSIFNIDPDQIDISHDRAGKADINHEYKSSVNPRFILHDSQGFEHGSDENLTKVENFLQFRQKSDLPERIHAI